MEKVLRRLRLLGFWKATGFDDGGYFNQHFEDTRAAGIGAMEVLLDGLGGELAADAYIGLGAAYPATHTPL
jgi:hypothetical protein